MKLLALAIALACSNGTPWAEATIPAPPFVSASATLSPETSRGVARLVNDIEALYKAAYRYNAGARWHAVLAVRYQHKKLQIVYRVRDRKEIVYVDFREVEPRSRYHTGTKRAAVYDAKTGKEIFCLLRRKADAAVLLQDLQELKEMVSGE